MLGQYPDRPYEGEPLNVIISNTSSPDVLKPEGFLIWATALGFGVSCLGQGDSQTCLLYTSPSPRDKRQNRMPSSA